MPVSLTGLAAALNHVALPLAQAAPPSAQNDVKPFIFMVAAMGALAWVLLIRPKKAEDKQRQQMMDSLAKGDQIVTIGGIHGSVEAIDTSKGIVSVTVAPKTTIRVNKIAIASVTKSKSAAGKEGKEED